MAKNRSEKGKKTSKERPDVSKLAKARPGKVPRVQPKEVVEAPRKKPNYRWLCYAAFGILVLGLFAFTNCMTNDFVFNDHFNYLIVQEICQDGKFWTNAVSSAVVSPLSQQFVKISFAFDLLGFGTNAAYSHAVNIFMHIFTALLFFIFVFRLAWYLVNDERLHVNPYHIAIAATALLSCHPLTSGAVTYISGRGPLLCALNYFCALNCFLFAFLEGKVGRAIIGYAFGYLFLAFGLECNAQASTVPFVVLTCMLLLKPRSLAWRDWFAERWQEMALVFVAGVGLFIFANLQHPTVVDNGFGLTTLSPILYISTQFKTLVTYYLRCFFAPFGLSVDPPYILSSGLADPGTLAGIAMVIAAVYLVWRLRSNPIVCIGLSIFLIGLFPWLFQVQPEVVADQRFYISLCGLAMVFGWAVANLAVRHFKQAVALLAVAVVACTTLTVWRNVGWRNQNVLWWRALKMNPSSARSAAQLAVGLLRNDKLDDAEKYADDALKRDPTSLDATIVLGDRAFKMKEYPTSVKYLQSAVDRGHALNFSEDQMAPLNADLAKALFKNGEFTKAALAAQAAYPTLPKDSGVRMIIGKAYLDAGQLASAMQEFQESYRFDQYNLDLFEPFTQCLLDMQQPQYSSVAFGLAQRALFVNHSHSCLLLFARAAIGLGNLNAAEEKLTVALQMKPNDPSTIYLISVLYKLEGRAQEAKTLEERALAMDKNVKVKNSVLLPTPEQIKAAQKRFRDVARMRRERNERQRANSESAHPGATPNPGSSDQSQISPGTDAKATSPP